MQRYSLPKELRSPKLIGIDTDRSIEESLARLYHKLIEGNLEMLSEFLSDKGK